METEEIKNEYCVISNIIFYLNEIDKGNWYTAKGVKMKINEMDKHHRTCVIKRFGNMIVGRTFKKHCDKNNLEYHDKINN